MRVLLINPSSPFLINENAQPPLGLLYLVSVLEAHDIHVDLWDMAVVSDFLIDNYDFYGVTAATPQYAQALELLYKIRAVSDSPICLGGAHASSLPQDCKKDDWDYIVVGEGEDVIYGLVMGEYPRGIVKGPSVNLDFVLPPARSKINNKNYCPEMTTEGDVGTILSSRGCPFNCSFCSKTVFPRGIKYHSVESVLHEIEIQHVDNFVILDDCFTLNRNRLFRLCDAIKHNHQIKFRCVTRVDLLDKVVLEALVKAGCTEISFGIESGSQKVLDAVNKRVTVGQNKNAILMAKDYGILTKAYLMYGLPMDDEETAQETLDFVLDVKPDKWLLSTFVPFPGPDIWNNPSAYGIKHIDYDYRNYFTAGKEGKGGMVVEYDHIPLDTMMVARDNLIKELRSYKEMFR
jgi:anaerobic magnesium-protoporphyrin IX monomethyl ester cyclase